jgi:hypothetical protein
MVAALVVAIATAQRVAAQEPAAAEPEQQVVRRAVINVPAMSLELFENDELVKSYAIAVGKRSTPTPRGTFQVVTKVKNPAWYGPGGEVVKPGRNNPVGTRWMGLALKGYGIHGTNDPKSIGRAASHGCVRMLNSDVEELFARMQIGDQVEILYQTELPDGTTLRDVYGLTPQRNGRRSDGLASSSSLGRTQPSAASVAAAAAGAGEGGN